MPGLIPRCCSATAALALIATACSGSGYTHRDAHAMEHLQTVTHPLARELVTRFRFDVNRDPSPDPYVDAPANPQPSPLQIVKTGPDLVPLDGRPSYAFTFLKAPFDQPTVGGELKMFDVRTITSDFKRNMMVETDYVTMTPGQVEAMQGWERQEAWGELSTAVLGGLVDLAQQAEADAARSDAVMRRRMVLESGAIDDSAPEGTRLALYYQIVMTGKGELDEYNWYTTCVAQLHQVAPDGSVAIVDGEGFGIHSISWLRDEEDLPPLPAGYGTKAEMGHIIKIEPADDDSPTSFPILLWQIAYPMCRIATSRLAERRSGVANQADGDMAARSAVSFNGFVLRVASSPPGYSHLRSLGSEIHPGFF